MSTLIALGHKARSGKDTVAKYLVEEHGFISFAFAEPLKQMVAAAFPGVTLAMLHDEELKMKPVPFWPSETPARLCQRIAQGVRSEYGQDFWAQIMKRRLEAQGFFDEGQHWNVVITDLRTPAEVELVKAWGGYAVKVERSRDLRGDTGRPDDHWTEVALDNYGHWDEVLFNNSSKAALYEQVNEMILNIELG